jgi:DNA-binding NarL/FixJ family response regulator
MGGRTLVTVLDADAKVRVVVVDDPLEAVGVAASLAGSGFDVVATIVDIAQLTATVEACRPGLVVIAMVAERGPRVDAGVADVVTRLATRVLALTPDNSPAAVQAALESGCLGVVPRTASVEAFVDAARAVAAGERHFHQHSLTMWLDARDERGPAGAGSPLSGRELAVLGLVAEGFSNIRIAERFELSASTIKTHIENLLRKLHATDRAHAVSIAMRTGVLR